MKQNGHLIGTPTKDALDCGPGNTSKDSGTHTPSREEIFQVFEEMYNPELSLELTEGVTISPANCQAAYRYAIWRYACEVAEAMKHCQGKDKKYGELRFYSWALSQLWAGKPKQYLSDYISYPSTLPVMLDESMRKKWLDNLMKKINFFQSELNDFATTVTWDEIVTVVDNNYPEVVVAILDGHGFKIDSTNEFCQSNLDVAKTVINALMVKGLSGKKHHRFCEEVFNHLSAAINIFAFARLATVAMQKQHKDDWMIPMAIKHAMQQNEYSESIDIQFRRMDHDGQKALVAFVLGLETERLDVRFNRPIILAVFNSGAIYTSRFCACIDGSFHNKYAWNSSIQYGSDRGCLGYT